jgi:hypothetical protein
MATTNIPYKRFWSCRGFPTSIFSKLRKLRLTWKSKLIIPYNFNKFRFCNNLKKNHELQMIFVTLTICHNPNLWLTTKVRVCKGEGQEGSPGVTFHALGSVGKCEGMNPHTPKWAPTLGVGVLIDFWIFKKKLQGSKPIGLGSSLYHWKDLET